jgi:pimeloyl-ACP methyl ester carboxylesterase
MMNMPEHSSASTVPNRYVGTAGRTIAYRSVGSGTPMILCNRFRGTMDSWDPAFIDALASHGIRAITFDYSGLGSSSGTPDYDPEQLAQDAIRLSDALELDRPVIAGWSLGGIAAQIALAMAPERFSHAVLIGTTPPGDLVKGAEQLFYDTASRAEYGLEDEVVLFFEPRSAESVAAARRSAARLAARTRDRSPAVPIDFAVAYLGNEPRNPAFPSPAVLEFLRTTSIPILHIGADHDIIFPVENWYALNPQLPTLQLITYPRSGHGPQSQHPESCEAHIAAFIGRPAA